jgi:hypothetical protein
MENQSKGIDSHGAISLPQFDWLCVFREEILQLYKYALGTNRICITGQDFIISFLETVSLVEQGLNETVASLQLEFELHHMTNDSFRQGPVETYVLYPIK